MLTENEAQAFAHAWIEAWNSHNLEAIMSYYAPEVVLVSPTAAKILNCSSGVVEGTKALRAYFARGLERYPNLTFELKDVLAGISNILVYYVSEAGIRTGEFMEFGSHGKIIRVAATKSHL
ncbi:MAG: nuclear transport factor 2 family protein [Acidobacteria bacterium]|nr:nuclear transport factor 2 family protein [Acidobacteriota bacterium]